MARLTSGMNLEDHVGDVLRKARQGANISAAAAAKVAAISEEELNALEATGQMMKRPNLPELAELVGLNAKKLEGIANGWLPESHDLSLWRELRVITTSRD